MEYRTTGSGEAKTTLLPLVLLINREDVQENHIEQCETGTTACGRPIGKQACWGLMSLLLGQSSYPVALPEYIDVCSQGVVGRTESHHHSITALNNKLFPLYKGDTSFFPCIKD